MRPLILLPIVAMAALVAACTSDDGSSGHNNTTATGTTSTHSGGAGGSMGTGGPEGGSPATCNPSTGEGGMSCVPQGYTTTPDGVVVDTVTVDVEDLQGNPMANTMAEICGFDVCHSGMTDANGHAFINAANDNMDEPRLRYGNDRTYVMLQAPLPNPPTVTFGLIHTARLPDAATGVELVPGQQLSSGDVTLTLDAGTYIKFSTLDYCYPEEQTFRAVTIPLPPTTTLPGVDPTLGFEMLFGMAPTQTLFCPSAQMTVPNAPNWAPNVPVEFWLQGIELDEKYAPYGGWGKVSDGAVSSDGSKVSTTAGQGIPVIGVIAVRLTP